MAYSPPTPYAPLTGQLSYGSGLQFVDEVLSQVAKQFAPEGHIYDQVVTHIPVQYRVGRYPVFDPSTFFAAPAMEVADDAETPLYDFNWSHDIYNAQVRRGATRLTQEELLQANPALRLDYSKLRGLMTIFANAREQRLATRLRAQSNGGQFTNAAITPAVKWDAGTSGAPATIQTDIVSGLLAAIKACGKRPNTLVIDWEVAAVIANDYTVKQQLQYRVGPEMLSTAEWITNGDGVVLPRKLFGLNVVVADGVLINQARPGQAMSLAATWSGARLIYCDPNPQWGIPGTVYSFRAPVTGTAAEPPSSIMPTVTPEPGTAVDYAVVDRWWTMDPPGETIRVRECVDERVVAPELGVEIQGVLTGGSSYNSSEY